MQGRRIAFLATDGVEQSELEGPWKVVQESGGTPTLVSIKGGEIQATQHDDAGDRIPVQRTLDDVSEEDFDGLVLPGGVANPDRLRTDERAVRFVRQFFEADKPVAAICHGPWMLVEADVVRGRTLTSWPSLRTDITNAGGEWVDEPVHVDQKLVTSRKPADIPQFNAKLLAVFSRAADERQLDDMVEQTFPASDPLPSGITLPGGDAGGQHDTAHD